VPSHLRGSEAVEVAEPHLTAVVPRLLRLLSPISILSKAEYLGSQEVYLHGAVDVYISHAHR